MNQIAHFAGLALSTCPRTSWEAGPTYDYSGQSLSFETIERQIVDDSERAKAKTLVMLVEWAMTGKWPAFRNAPVYFVRVILEDAASKLSWPPVDSFPSDPPPWKSGAVAEFLNRTALFWYSVGRKTWARDLAHECLKLQKQMEDTHSS